MCDEYSHSVSEGGGTPVNFIVYKVAVGQLSFHIYVGFMYPLASYLEKGYELLVAPETPALLAHWGNSHNNSIDSNV